MATGKSTKKKASKPEAPLKERAIRAALDLAAAEGWDSVTMQSIARRCKCTLGALQDMFEDRSDIVAAYERQVDKKVLDNVNSPDLDAPERDRLFDVLMERFDVLNEDREGVVAIIRAVRRDPKQILTGCPHIGKSMVWMLEAAAIDTTGPKGSLTALGLLGVYLFALNSWVDDGSEDMAKTMAALDKALGRAEQLAGLLRF